MPLTPPQLTQETRDAIRQWITDGAAERLSLTVYLQAIFAASPRQRGDTALGPFHVDRRAFARRTDDDRRARGGRVRQRVRRGLALRDDAQQPRAARAAVLHDHLDDAADGAGRIA